MRFQPTDVSVKAWLLRWAMGPASIVDGVVGTLTFGVVGTSCAFTVARTLARHRIALRDE